MLFELRAYDLKPGTGPAYLDHFRKAGIQFVTRHLPLAGYWLTDSGALNRLYHLWVYDSLDERLACRAGLAGDSDWNAGFVPKGFPLIVAQQNRIMQLETGSTMLDGVVKSRKMTHPAHDDETPMFTSNYLSLTLGTTQGHDAQMLGSWRVVSGADHDEVVTLFRHEKNDPMATATGSKRHELMRALTGSPLA
jgi:hypothetical protein